MTRDLQATTTPELIPSRHFLRRSLIAALVVCGLLSAPLSAVTVARKKEIARDQFENAERMREALNGRPTAQRTIRDYQLVMAAYRKVYYVAPTSSKADAAIVAVAELLVEKGRQFHNNATLQDAVGQYEFLRKEYPGSKYRVEALFTMGQIYKDDLNDAEKARETFQEYLKHYPHSRLADEAKQALKELDDSKSETVSAKTEVPNSKASVKDASKNDSPTNGPAVKEVAAQETPKDDTEDHSGPRALVTGVRHWSTPDYTRIAIDLEDEIGYESGRIPNPDRIYFDLKNTRLSSVLKGKAFDVDDGFLKKIRIAQFDTAITRVVLEVGDDVGEYSAFILPNPYRLVIDVHGKTPAKLVARTQPQSASASVVSTPALPTVNEKEKPETETIAKKPEASSLKKPANRKTRSAKAAEPKENHNAEDKLEVAKAEPAKAQSAKKEPTETSKQEILAQSKPPAKSADEGVQVAKKEIPTKIVEPDSAPVTSKQSTASASDSEAKVDTKKTEVASRNTAPERSEKVDPSLRIRGKKRQAPNTLDVRTAKPTMDGDRSLIRALGLKIGRIVVDAGHGGHDTGTIGPNGLREKDLVLDVALRLGKLLENRLGADVVYTRDDDTFIPLETRTAIANQQQADLFISVHANSSRDSSARGVETYYLNFTSSRDALEVAARENAVSEKSVHELQDLVKKIALKDKIEESREFAADVQNSLHSGLSSKAPAIRDRGVKKAPFIVLIGANMPSILAEISFISNPTDEKKLRTEDYRQKIAESLYKGVAKYAGGLSGVKVAARFNKDQGD